MQQATIEGKEVAIAGVFPRIARLEAEHHDFVEDPEPMITALRARGGADLFTFMQRVSQREPKYDYPLDPDNLAVLHVDSYEDWWARQLNDKTRNMVRKAEKHGVEVRVVRFDDELVRGIQVIYNESPLRQGKPFKHYGKDFETLKAAHATLLDRSQFIGAYGDGALIGFIKLVYHGDTASIMQIISMFEHRNKAPTNALLAKAVQVAVERGVTDIQYGIWSRRSMGAFKRHSGFERVAIPRYYVPLNAAGSLALRLGLHRPLTERLPEAWVDRLVALRAKWYARRYPSP